MLSALWTTKSPGQPSEEVYVQTLEGEQMLTCYTLQIELGTAVGKLFRCGTMAIIDAGDSDILSDQVA